MPILVKISVRTEEIQWQGTDMVVPFIAEPRGLPSLGSSVVFPAASFTATQAAAQFKSLVIAWIGQQQDYASLPPLQPADISVLGGFQ